MFVPLGLLAASLIWATASTAGSLEGIAFTNDAVLRVDRQTIQPVVVEVVNASDAPQVARLAITSSGASMPTATVGPASLDLPPGASGAFSVRLVPPDEGTVSGAFLLSTASGLVATRPFVLAGDSVAGYAALNEPLPETLTGAAWRWTPFSSDLVSPLTIPVQADLLPFLASASLLNERGIVLRADTSSGLIEVSEANDVGIFKGTMADAGGDPATIAMTVTVADSLLVPALAILLGIGLAAVLEHWWSYWQPRLELRGRLAEWRETSKEISDAAQLDLNKLDRWAGSDPPRALRLEGTSNSFWTAVEKRVLDSFERVKDGDERGKRWGVTGSESEKVAAYPDALREANDLGLSINRRWWRILGASDLADSWLEEDELAGDVRDALEGGDVTDPTDLATRLSKRREVARILKALDTGLSALAELRRLPDAERFARQLDACEQQLLGQPFRDEESLKRSLDRIRDLADKILSVAEPRDDHLFLFLGIDVVPRDTALYRSLMRLATIWEPTTEGPGIDVVPLRSSEDIGRDLFRRNLAFGLLAAAVAFGTGIQTQYAGNATFGTPGDYLGALLWGFGAAVVLDLARRLPSAQRLARSITESAGE